MIDTIRLLFRYHVIVQSIGKDTFCKKFLSREIK